MSTHVRSYFQQYMSTHVRSYFPPDFAYRLAVVRGLIHTGDFIFE